MVRPVFVFVSVVVLDLERGSPDRLYKYQLVQLCWRWVTYDMAKSAWAGAQ